MKKQLLFVAAFVATMFGTVNAQTTYDFRGIQASDITINPAETGEIGTYKLDEVDVPSVSYKGAESAVMTVTFTGKDNLALTYKNGSAKSNILKCGPEFLQTDGKNVIIVLSNVTVGQVISLNVKAKGGTAATFEGTGCTADASNPASIDNSDFQTISFTATDSNVSIKETTGGYRITTLTIGGGAPNNIASSVAEKVIIGTEYYNVAGVKMTEAQKGLNIVKNIYEDGSVQVTKTYIK